MQERRVVISGKFFYVEFLAFAFKVKHLRFLIGVFVVIVVVTVVARFVFGR